MRPNNINPTDYITLLLREQLRRSRARTTTNESEEEENDEEEDTNLIRRLISGRMPFLGRTSSNSRSSNQNESPDGFSSNIPNEETFLTRVQNLMPHRSQDQIRSVISRVGRYSSNFQENLIEHYNELRNSITREEPRSRRYYREDDIAESFDELFFEDTEKYKQNESLLLKIKSDEIHLIDNSYIDYKEYPLKIDWEEINDSKSLAYEVLEKFGYLGCSIYTNLFKKGYKTKYHRLDSEVLQLFTVTFRDYEKKKTNLEFAINKIESLLSCIPSLKELYSLLKKRLVSEKEIIIFKVLIDIYEIYYKNFLALIGSESSTEGMLTLFLPTANLFISTMKKSAIPEGLIKNENAYESLKWKISQKIILKEAYKEFNKLFNDNFLSTSNELMKKYSDIQKKMTRKTIGYKHEDFIK